MQRNKRKIVRVATALFCLLLVAMWLPPRTNVTARARLEASATQDEMIVARVTVRNASELDRLIKLGLDLLEMRDGDDLFILTTPARMEALSREGWLVKQDAEQSALLLKQPFKTGGLNLLTFNGGYRTVTEIRAALNQAVASYPNLAETFVYGNSWQRETSGGAAGHELFGIRLTNRQRSGPKPIFFLMAAIHARELVTSELALRFMDYLLQGYGTDADATWFLDEHQIVIVPVVNPDGRVLAEQGYYQRKNLNNTYGGNCSTPPSAFDQVGVDLNRNASFQWGVVNAPTEPPCGQTYPGPSPASEPETHYLEDLVRSLFADQRGPLDTDAAPATTSGVMITLHSFSDLVLWPWGATSAPAPNAAALSAIGRKFASYNGYTAQQSIQLYPTSGTTDDWAYGELGIAAFTFEVGPSSGACGGFFPAFSCLDGGTGGAFWPRNLPAFIYAARIARTPYTLAHGPTVSSVTATTGASGQLQINALVSDQANGNQAITAAEYYVDTPPWRGGVPHALTSTDGSFNSVSENVTATTLALDGRHIVYVRGQDSSGNWGPVSAAFTPQTSSGNWSATALSATEVDIQTWRQSDANTYAKVKLTFPTAGYRVQDQSWGMPSRTGNQITADALVEKSNNASLQTETTTVNIYNLGALADGSYSLIFKTSGQTAKTVNFTVTSATPPPNPIDNQREFVRWQYKDFLGREPDAAGWDFWTDNITLCLDAARRPAGVSIDACLGRQRETTSAAFFLSPEFQYTGYFVYRLYKGALGRAPYLSEFTPDQQLVGAGIANSTSGQLDAARINQNKRDFAALFVQRAEFLSRYGSLSNQQYVDLLFQTTGVTPSSTERQALVNGLDSGGETRASVLWKVVDGINVISEGNQQFTTAYGQAFYNREFNSAFVQMEYFGYMRRDPDNPGYQFWLGKLTSFPSYIEAEMVKSFVVSPEYRSRFGAP